MKTRSLVTHPAPAPAADALRHFEARLSYETDCADVWAAVTRGKRDFVLLDVRSPELFAAGHLPEAINLPHGRMSRADLEAFGEGAVFVTYCAGPHCNGSTRAAIRIAREGFPVKEMPGGIEGWKDEGFELVVDV